MQKHIFLLLISLLFAQMTYAQVTLKADGPGETYELISSVLAPGYNPIEAPDCSHPAFGRHIEEVFDSTLNAYVFRFYIHTHEDNDRCINFDRQRNEIKTYDKSPDNLLGVENEVVQYTWKFKLDATFQPSSKFTHLHQLKAVGGSESSMPLITLTARSGSPQRMELRYAESTSQTTIEVEDLADFKGKWLEVIETVTYGEVGTGQYELSIIQLSNQDTLFHYANPSIRMWKTEADFIRPKWGIYRSLQDSTQLKDEEVDFADFSIEEIGSTVRIENQPLVQGTPLIYPNPTQEFISLSPSLMEACDRYSIYSKDGKKLLHGKIPSGNISLASLPTGMYVINLHQGQLKIHSESIFIQ